MNRMMTMKNETLSEEVKLLSDAASNFGMAAEEATRVIETLRKNVVEPLKHPFDVFINGRKRKQYGVDKRKR